MAIIKNLTPHTVTILNEDGSVLAAFESEGVARATQKTERVGEIEGIPLVRTTFGEPIDLPDPEEGTYFIVSPATANAAREYGLTTKDLLLTCEPVRNAEGQIIGCRSLAQL